MNEEADERDIFIADEVYPEAAALFEADYKTVSEVVSACDVVLDTNVLLTPYSAGKNSLEQIRAVYTRLSEEKRLFVPGQVAREYTRWRARKLTELYQAIADRRSKVAKPPTECSPCRRGRSRDFKPIRPPGRCRRSSG